MSKQKILVTGGTGFLGSYLLRMLVRDGRQVRATCRDGSRRDLLREIESKIEWIEADVNDLPAMEEAFEGVSEVFHCAAMVSFHPRDVRQMMHTNVEGTANVVNLCLENGVRKLVHVSSIAAIGRTKQRPRLDEKSSWVAGKLNSNYANSKFQAEMEVWRGEAEGLKVGIVNPAIILGSGFWDSGSTRFFKQLHDGLKFYPVGRSGFVDVRDVARFMILLMDSPISGERFILNAENLNYLEFFKKVASHLEIQPPSIRVEPWLAEIGWRIEWLKEKLLGIPPVITKETARTSSHSFFYENAKSRSVFGFEYRDLDLTLAEISEQFLTASRSGFAPAVLPV